MVKSDDDARTDVRSPVNDGDGDELTVCCELQEGSNGSGAVDDAGKDDVAVA